jgi:ABC-2 type transport system ATP-binding protein
MQTGHEENGMQRSTLNTEARPADQAAVSVQNVEKTFRRIRFSARRILAWEPVAALRGVTFDVQPGEMVGLLGPNGAGKTTLLKIISTLIYPTHGNVLFYGRDNRDGEIKTRGMLGLVTCDERSFYWRLTGRANLMFFATLYRMPKQAAQNRIDELLAALNLTDAADQRFDGYSSGMKQKLSIARGLLSDPRIVLYDEPTRSLDPLSQRSIRQWIQQRREVRPEQTHLIATHHLVEAEELCDRVVIVNAGRVIAQGTATEMRRFFGEQCSTHLVTFADVPDTIAATLTGLDGVMDIRPVADADGMQRIRVTSDAAGRGLTAVLDHLIRQGARVLECSAEDVSLDDVFCSLVESDRLTAGSSQTERVS